MSRFLFVLLVFFVRASSLDVSSIHLKKLRFCQSSCVFFPFLRSPPACSDWDEAAEFLQCELRLYPLHLWLNDSEVSLMANKAIAQLSSIRAWESRLTQQADDDEYPCAVKSASHLAVVEMESLASVQVDWAEMRGNEFSSGLGQPFFFVEFTQSLKMERIL